MKIMATGLAFRVILHAQREHPHTTSNDQVHGKALGLLDRGPEDARRAWHEVGRDLARVHEGVGEHGAVTGLECEPLPDPMPLPDELASAGYFTSEEARWLSGWLDLLAPFALAPLPRRFRHGDLQTTNVMVRPDPPTYLALIDWGACGWGDVAHDFAGIPLRAVPFMLAGYREVAPLVEDETAEAPHSRDSRGPSVPRR